MDSRCVHSDGFVGLRRKFSSIDERRHATSVRLDEIFRLAMFRFRFRIYELERLAQVPNKFQFPLFETFHWYAAKWFYDELKGERVRNFVSVEKFFSFRM